MKISTIGAILLLLGICLADSASIIPTILLCGLGGTLIVGAGCAKHC